MKKFVILLLFLVFVFALPSIASAHDASLTYTTVTLNDKTIDVVLTTPYTNILKSYPEPDKTLDEIDPRFFQKPFQNGFLVQNDGIACTPHLKVVKNVTSIKALAYHFRFTCPTPLAKVHFLYKLFFNVSPTHENITEFHVNKVTQQIIFSSTKHVYDFDYGYMKFSLESYQLFVNVTTFLKIGIEHILTGYDHVLFLLGLLVVTRRFRNLLTIVTSFTLAHSITLSIASLGIFLLPPKFTESMIALSIVYIGIENILILSSAKKNPKIKRWIITFLFGLIHGFGFSSVLREYGLPKEQLVTSLVSFNAGVEIGQLLIVACVFPLVWFIHKKSWSVNIIKGISVIIAVFGVIWFVQRAFFS